ncbi:MAG: S-methyl-5'-thioadenosine phosphorylase [Thermodesulfovibrionales bacterium]
MRKGERMAGIKIGIIGGSGMDDPNLLKNKKEKKVTTPYGSPSSALTTGKIGGVDVVILARHGKKHSIYPTGVNFRANIHALKKEGCTHILATTAVGSLREKIRPGDLVFVDQFIDFTKHRNLTFHDKKVVHTPMAEPFCGDLRKLLISAARELKLRAHNGGTVITIEGPRFSTKAESHMFRMWGADVINMSTVPEVILAREAGICYQSIAMSTDYDCWKEGEEPVTWEMILSIMHKNSENVKKLLVKTISTIQNTDCKCS